MSPAAVRLERVAVTYGDVPALTETSLEVLPGELLALLGPSGCGKTTLLRSIAGLVRHAGEIYIGGERATLVPPQRRNIGMVFQDYALFPHMTVAENVAFGLRMRRVERREAAARVNEVLGLVGMQGVKGRFPRQLSGGQQQRVALSRALVIRPSVLLLDEPLSALDKKLREETAVELRQLQRRLGITTVFVTHDQEESLALADRIAVMDHGHIEQIGGPVEIYERPASRFVADFIGRSNLLHATVLRCDAEAYVCLVGERETVQVPLWPGLAPGMRLTLSVRPEKLALSMGDDGVRRNVLHGEIEHVTYLGMLTELRVRLATGDLVEVVEQNSVRSAQRKAREVAQRVALCWDPEETILIEAEAR
jgi:spermidine/putrescine ABC transporter ATP-binding subunit